MSVFTNFWLGNVRIIMQTSCVDDPLPIQSIGVNDFSFLLIVYSLPASLFVILFTLYRTFRPRFPDYCISLFSGEFSQVVCHIVWAWLRGFGAQFPQPMTVSRFACTEVNVAWIFTNSVCTWEFCRSQPENETGYMAGAFTLVMVAWSGRPKLRICSEFLLKIFGSKA